MYLSLFIIPLMGLIFIFVGSKKSLTKRDIFLLVGEVGLEPTTVLPGQILSLLCKPFHHSPSGYSISELIY